MSETGKYKNIKYKLSSEQISRDVLKASNYCQSNPIASFICTAVHLLLVYVKPTNGRCRPVKAEFDDGGTVSCSRHHHI